MSGPPPTPLRLRVLRGNPGKRPLRPEPEPRVCDTVPEPPPFLGRHAKAEWLRVAPELHALGLLTTLDLQTFAAYCWAFGHWRETEEALAALAPDDDGARVLTRISRRASEDMVRFAGGFGMTPAARSKVAAGDRTTKSKFDGLIG